MHRSKIFELALFRRAGGATRYSPSGRCSIAKLFCCHCLLEVDSSCGWLLFDELLARRVRGLPSWSNPSRLQRPTCFARRTHSFGYIQRRSALRMLTIRAFEIQQMVLYRPDRGPACRRQSFITHIKTHALLKQVRSCEPNSAFVHLPMYSRGLLLARSFGLFQSCGGLHVKERSTKSALVSI